MPPLFLPLTAFITVDNILRRNPESVESSMPTWHHFTPFYEIIKIQIPPSAPRKVVLFVLNRAAFLHIYKCFSLESYIRCFFDFAIPLTLPQTAKNTPPDGQIRRGCFMPFWLSGCHSNSASGRLCPSSSGRCCAHIHSA